MCWLGDSEPLLKLILNPMVGLYSDKPTCISRMVCNGELSGYENMHFSDPLKTPPPKTQSPGHIHEGDLFQRKHSEGLGQICETMYFKVNILKDRSFEALFRHDKSSLLVD